MTNKPLVLYWDSCAFIHRFGETPAYVEVLKEHIERAKRGDCRIATSAVSLAEVCKLPDLGLLPAEQTKKIMEFFKNDYLDVYQADRDLCTVAHQLIGKHGLTPMDAIHVATALAARASIMITTDTKKYRRKGLVTHDGKIGEPPLKIQLPNVTMFLELPGM
jgi:uncharacterized protein